MNFDPDRVREAREAIEYLDDEALAALIRQGEARRKRVTPDARDEWIMATATRERDERIAAEVWLTDDDTDDPSEDVFDLPRSTEETP